MAGFVVDLEMHITALAGILAGCVLGLATQPPALSTVAAGPMQGVPVVDQTTCDEPWAGLVGVDGATWKAQTFRAGRNGRLAYVELPGTNGGGRTRLQLWPADSCGVVESPAIATAEATTGTRFDFAQPPLLHAGGFYALVLSHEGAANYAWAYSGRADCYPDRRGGPFTSTDGGQTWSRDIVDFYFTTWMIPDEAEPAGDAVVHGAERTGAGSPAANAAALTAALARAAQRPPAAQTRNVFVISLPTGDADPGMLLAKSKDLAAAIREASSFHGYVDPDAQPALDFAIYQDTVFAESTMPPRCGGQDYDLGTLFEKYHICSLVQQGKVDEVWFWDGGLGGLPEYAVSGPEWELVGGTGMPDCGRQVALMVFHNGLDLGYALHSLGHRMENTMRYYRPCDFTSATWPWPQAPSGCRDGSASDFTGFIARPFAGNGFVGACGDVHWPPNIAAGMVKDYDYANPATARSICQDWRRDGQSTVAEISCATWGCSQLGYMTWWMQNLPGVDNTSRDRLGEPMPSWWTFLFGTRNPTPSPPDATATPTVPGPTATLTATSTSEPLTATRTASPTATMVDDRWRRHRVFVPSAERG